MTNILICLLTLLFSMSSPAMERNADFWRSSLAAKIAGQLGQEGEAAVQTTTGLSKNTDSFIVNGRSRIPDFVVARDPDTGLPTQLIESKNVQYQSLTRQLRDYSDLVGTGGRVDVALPSSARVSGPLQRAFENPNNPLFRMKMNLPQ
jgi:Restriction endonuclease fold toxin 7